MKIRTRKKRRGLEMIAVHDSRKVLTLCLFIFIPSIAWQQVQTYQDQYLVNQFGDLDDLGGLGYQTTNLGPEELDGQLCWRLQMDGIPEKDPPYPKMVMLVRQCDNYPLRVDYYNDRDITVKTLSVRTIKEIDGVPMEMELTMKDYIDGTETSFNLTFNYELSPIEGNSVETELKR